MARAADTDPAPRQQRKKNDQDKQYIHPHNILLHDPICFKAAPVLFL
jgi:hypothetical protein